MSLLNKEDDVIEDVIFAEIYKFLCNHLPRTIYMDCIEEYLYNPDYLYPRGEFLYVPITFHGVQIKPEKINEDTYLSMKINKVTYHESSLISCSRLRLKKVDGEYVITPKSVRWPIILQNIKLDHLPSYIKFDKNHEEKYPLRFIVRATGEDNWIYDLPKGSIVLLIQSDLMNILSKTDSNWFRGKYDFSNNPYFMTFMSDYGKICII